MADSEDVLKSARVKLDWAGEKLQLVDAKLRAHLAANPYEVVREHDARVGCDVLRMKVAGKPPLPTEISNLVAEFGTALYASLDHLAWALAVAPKNERGVGYPVCDTAKGFRESVGRKLDGVAGAARDAIERLQPYHAPQPHAHPLWRIHKLSNTDKHRSIIAVPYSFMYVVGGAGFYLHAALGKRLDEDPQVPIPPLPPELAAEMDFKVQPTFAVVLQNAGADDGILMPLHELPTLRDFVRDEVFPALERAVAK